MIALDKLMLRVRRPIAVLTVSLMGIILVFACAVRDPAIVSEPEATPAASPTSTTTDSSTSDVPDPPTPIPTVILTPTPPYLDTWQSLENARWLEENRPALADAILSLPWVADGIDASERPGVQALVNLEAMFGQEDAPALLGRSWLADGLSGDELTILQTLDALAGVDEEATRQLIDMPFLDSIEPEDAESANLLHTLATQYPGLFKAVLLKPWVEDGLNARESAVLQSLVDIAGRDEEAAVRILGMPFLDTVEDADTDTTDSLRMLASADRELFQAVLAKGWVADGLDADELTVLQSLVTIANLDQESALGILAMAFLETVDTTDVESVEILAGLATRELAFFKAVVSRSWVEDGLNGDEEAILQMLEGILDSRLGSEVWLATLALYDTPTTFSEGGLAYRYDANGNNAIEHDELIAAIAEFSGGRLTENELGDVTALYGFSSNLVPTPALKDLAYASPWYRDGIDADKYHTERRGVGALEEISDTNPDLATEMLRWGWLFDEPLVIAESSAIEELAPLARMSPELGHHLVNLPWVWDGVEQRESSALNDLRHLGSRGHVDLVVQLGMAPWVVDGVTFVESFFGIDRLVRIATVWDSERPDSRLRETC